MSTRSERRKARRSAAPKGPQDAAIISFPRGSLAMDDRVKLLAILKGDPNLVELRKEGTEIWFIQNDDFSTTLWVRGVSPAHRIAQVFVMGWLGKVSTLTSEY